MEQRRIRKGPIERCTRKIQAQEILHPHFASAVCTCHGGERRRSFHTDGDVTKAREGREVASRSAAEIQNAKRWRAFDVPQKRFDVLAHVVITRAFPECLRALLVMP